LEPEERRPGEFGTRKEYTREVWNQKREHKGFCQKNQKLDMGGGFRRWVNKIIYNNINLQ
jgi:hypothetical protein